MGSAMLTPEQIEDLLAGNYYVNVHTALNPSGEMRGQIYPAHTWAFAAMLSGANEAPPVDSPATGQALLTLSADMSELYRPMVMISTGRRQPTSTKPPRAATARSSSHSSPAARRR